MSVTNDQTSARLHDYIAGLTGASGVIPGEHIQSLWSGYGEIRRYRLQGVSRVNARNNEPLDTIVVKDINPPARASHPRGWNTSLSNTRKLRSFEVEAAWYEGYASSCDAGCRVAHCYGTQRFGERTIIVMEDLDTDYPQRSADPDDNRIRSCLDWLARFHARFLALKPVDLWPTGTYWHLDTRPDEYDAMPEGGLKQASGWLDQQLADCEYQTLVHGDAKIANFCFSAAGNRVAAVDFQYVGGGVGIRDVAYFLGSCMTEQELVNDDQKMLAYYAQALIAAIEEYHPTQPAQQIASSWLDLYAVAWTDFYRFLAGWMPDHPKTHAYTRRLADEVLADRFN